MKTRSLICLCLECALIALLIKPTLSQAEDVHQPTHKIASYNVWFDRGTGNTRFPLINKQLQELNQDIVFLQEVTPQFINVYKHSDIRKSYSLYTSTESEQTYGQAFLSKHLLIELTSLKLTSKYNRSAFFALYPISDQQAIILINVHLESGQFESSARSKQIKEIQTELIAAYTKQHKTSQHSYDIAGILWGGDFNIDGDEQHALLNERWIDSAIQQAKEEITTYTIETNSLAQKTASFFEGSSRLDRFYLSNQTALAITKYQVLTGLKNENTPLSDHYPILIELKGKAFIK